jgi:hypothetical protein
MSSKGVGKSELMTLASKLFGCAVPSRTCTAKVIQQISGETRPTGCNCDRGVVYHVCDALEFLRVAVRDAPIQHAVKRLHHCLRVCFVVVVGGGGNERGKGGN